MKVTLIEGTPEEILSVMPHLRMTGTVVTTAEVKSAPEDRNNSGEKTYIDTRVARKVLTRRGLKDQQIAVLKLLYKAHPKRVLATDVQKAIKYTPAQLAGLMGAFGRRLSHTEGYISGDWFFVQEWNQAAHCYEYGLPESIRQALEVEKLV
ncbi:hypothetical protein [Rhizobium leguminosarum]|uniref:hypothetical protein n=1 Tax=Rhizobium leguminosarum TaxID=384 RepID=UPI003F95AD62